MANGNLIIKERGERGPRLLFIEPYLNGSHRALAEALMSRLPGRWTLLALPGRFFRWRMRGAAAFLAEAAGEALRRPWDGLICSSMLNLAELKGLVPELAGTPALVYFHENQLAYPAGGAADERQERQDLFLAFSNLTSVAAAKLALFNSAYHRREVIQAAGALLAKLPDAVPHGLAQALSAKSRALAVPLSVEEANGLRREPRQGPLRILWNHRWSQDKDPRSFFAALFALAEQGLDFQVAVLGRQSGRPPAVFQEAASKLGPRLIRQGALEDRREYWRWLFWADMCVSTALQEYQGLAVAEAAWAGCRPLVPDALVYPELYPAGLRYGPGKLEQALAGLIAAPDKCRRTDYQALARPMTWQALAPAWRRALEELCAP
ncbi:hypothetical protein AAU61_10440 [Desulfocarbo indianensis]|nr:hypothetical protein AAU61_10440 [Desulfocarbo indianensis]